MAAKLVKQFADIIQEKQPSVPTGSDPSTDVKVVPAKVITKFHSDVYELYFRFMCEIFVHGKSIYINRNVHLCGETLYIIWQSVEGIEKQIFINIPIMNPASIILDKIRPTLVSIIHDATSMGEGFFNPLEQI